MQGANIIAWGNILAWREYTCLEEIYLPEQKYLPGANILAWSEVEAEEVLGGVQTQSEELLQFLKRDFHQNKVII